MAMSNNYGTLALGLLLGVGLGPALAGQTAAELEKERQVLRTVSMFLERAHISGQTLDNSVSRRALDSYLKSLDPMKLYFTESDIDGFMDLRDALDEMVKEGDAQFANMVFDRLLERVDERVEEAESLLQEDSTRTRFSASTIPRSRS